MAKTVEIKPEDMRARAYTDRLILETLADMHEAVKLSEVADRLQANGIGLAAIRSLLASNPEKFAYNERRWIPAARLEAEGRPLAEAARVFLDRFGGPASVELVVKELSHARELSPEEVEATLRRFAVASDDFFITERDELALRSWVFGGHDEPIERAVSLYHVDEGEVSEAEKKLGKIDWKAPDAIEQALKAASPVTARTLGYLAWLTLSPQAPHAPHLYNWRTFNAKLLAVPGFVFGADGLLSSEEESKKWVAAAIKLADKLAPSVEIEDAAPIEIKPEDVAKMVKKIVASEDSITSTKLLEEFYEITPSVKTFPDDMANIMAALKADSNVWWVGGDRFRKPATAPDFIESVPDVFKYVHTEFKDEDDEYVDVELSEEGLSSTLRKLLSHPLATDVLDEDPVPAPRQQPEQVRMVLKSIHRELGTFPLCQIPTGWLDAAPRVQELIFVDSHNRELQVWANMEARLLFNLIDWFYEQPVESGAVFTLTRTTKANVFEFAWMDQTDPVVFITSQRMEELRDMQARSEDMSTLQILQEVMSHWPKGADFLTLLWEANVVRRSSRRLIASLLSSYACFYQRSGSPVWHYDSKKVEQGFDKSKRKFVLKRS